MPNESGTTYSSLASPVRIGATELPNRVALAPMTRVSATAEGHATDRMASYYEKFARGGFGLIITEGMYIDTQHSQGYLYQPGIATESQAEAWKQVVDASHRSGARIFAQLMHAGAQSQGNTFVDTTIGPSAIAPKGEQLSFYRGSGPYRVPSEISKAQISEVRGSFVRAALRAQAAGFDGIEIHGANGYLIDQFLTGYLNVRSDHYGGSSENRVRLASEICRDIVEAVGPGMTVGIRISQAKVSDTAHRWPGGAEDARTIFRTLGETGIDYIHTTEYRAEAPAFEDTPESLAALAKQYSGVAIIANGSLDHPEAAAAMIRNGSADVIALGKAALVNRDWLHRVRGDIPLDTEMHPGLLAPIADIKDWELHRETPHDAADGGL
ncbi:putative 12-oxophytodienoate reductase 2 [Arthrobacter sp. Hiyo4]|nr:putative 12-oxophytodienoate reductase 2 [Arthrobacter sp. Hiyo4]